MGKDLIARAIHQNSRRASGPFIKINSTAIPETLLESELFGYEQGAFTGARPASRANSNWPTKARCFWTRLAMCRRHPGKAAACPAGARIRKAGRNQDVESGRPMIAATNRDLRAALEEGTFREDLYYRLNVVPIDIPPLREHKEDIPELVSHFLARFAADNEKEIGGITPAAVSLLMEYHWPGNVRQLENSVERAVALASGHGDRRERYHLDPSRCRAKRLCYRLPQDNFLPEGMTLEQWEDNMIKGSVAAGERKQKPGGTIAGPVAKCIALSSGKTGCGRRGLILTCAPIPG